MTHTVFCPRLSGALLSTADQAWPCKKQKNCWTGLVTPRQCSLDLKYWAVHVSWTDEKVKMGQTVVCHQWSVVRQTQRLSVLDVYDSHGVQKGKIFPWPVPLLGVCHTHRNTPCWVKLQNQGVILVLETLEGFGRGSALMCWAWLTQKYWNMRMARSLGTSKPENWGALRFWWLGDCLCEGGNWGSKS